MAHSQASWTLKENLKAKTVPPASGNRTLCFLRVLIGSPLAQSVNPWQSPGDQQPGYTRIRISKSPVWYHAVGADFL